MRKGLLEMGAIACLVLVTGIAGVTVEQFTPIHQVIAQTPPIALTLPPLATVYLKGESSMSGRLTNVNSQVKKITLELSGQSAKVSMVDIEKIEFKGEIVLRNGNKLVIRGDDDNPSTNNNQKTWREPLTHFKLINQSKGQAQIQLSSVTNLELRGIRVVAAKSTYVVNEIQFEPSGTIKIKVTPH